jgi:hypothetical protein
VTDGFDEEFGLDWLGTEAPAAMGDPQQVALYGPAGHGKTRLMASACEVDGYWPMLIVDTEGSAVGTVANYPADRLRVKRVHNIKEYNEVIRDLRTKPHPFKMVSVDTFGQVMDWKQAQIWANPLKTQGGADDTQKMWGKLFEYGKVAVDALRNAPFKTGIIMHEKEERDNVGVMYSRMWINGQLKAYLPTKPDLTGLLVAETDEKTDVTTRTVWFGPDATRATKTRFEELGLPNKMTNPTMADIVGAIREHIGGME